MLKNCVAAIGAMRFSVAWLRLRHFFVGKEGRLMPSKKLPPQKVSIGNKDSDKELMQRIFEYQQEKGIRYTADAVRSLCEDALAIKKALK